MNLWWTADFLRQKCKNLSHGRSIHDFLLAVISKGKHADVSDHWQNLFTHAQSKRQMIFACTFSGFDQIPLFSIQLQERKKVSSSAPSKMTKMIQRGLTVKKTGRTSWFRLFRSWISSTAFFKSWEGRSTWTGDLLERITGSYWFQ